MRDLFIPINKENNNENKDCKQERNILCNRYNNVDIYNKCTEDDMYEIYYQDYLEQCKWEELIEAMELIGILVI